MTEKSEELISFGQISFLHYGPTIHSCDQNVLFLSKNGFLDVFGD